MLRIYKYSDEVLLEYASSVAAHFENDLDLFNRFDAFLDRSKLEEFKALIQTAYREGSDELKVAVQQEHTEKMLEEMEKSRVMFNQVRYWAVKAFPRKRAIQRQFGIGKFSKLSDSQPRLVEFMQELAETVDHYWNDFRAVGAMHEFKQAVEEQAEALATANLAQEHSKAFRTVDTEERIARFNEIFDFLRLLNSAAEFVFADEPAKRELYRPPSRNQSVADEVEEVL